MKTEVTQHGIMWYSGGMRAVCPECRLSNAKFDSTGEEDKPVQMKFEVGEGEEKHTEFKEEMVKTSFVAVVCQECGCKFKVFK